MQHYLEKLGADENRPIAVERILGVVSSRLGLIARRASATEAIGAQFPREIRELEIPRIAQRSYSMLFKAMMESSIPSEDELVVLRDRAAQRAREGVPLTLLVHLWERGFRELLAECRTVAHDDEAAALGWIGTAVLRLQEVWLGELISAYQSEREMLTEEQSGAVPLITRLLLLGQDARADAERLGIVLAQSYDILALSIGSTDETFVEESARIVAERRRLHRILLLLRENGGTTPLSLLDRAGGYVLLPVDEHMGSQAERRNQSFVAALTSAAGAAVTVAEVNDVHLDGMAAGVAEADEVLKLCRALRLEPDLYRMEDVYMAYQIARPGPALDRLRAAVAELFAQPDLKDTLQVYFDCDLDRKRTASVLQIHRNTVDNRLNRIEAISPFSPFTVSGITSLSAALIADGLRTQP